MKQTKYDLLNYILKEKSINVNTLSIMMDYPVKKTSQLIAELIEDGYINEDFSLTDKTQQELRVKKPRNAIILADELGVGLLTVDKKVPTALLKINGEVVLERLIQQLHEVGIHEIDIIIGFSEEKYDYLVEKYKVNLIYNPEYTTKASLHSLKLVDDNIANTYILPANLWPEKNPFSQEELYSWYAISDAVDDNSIVRLKPQFGLIKVEKDKGGNSMIGISYILEKEGREFTRKMIKLGNKKTHDRIIWEQALFDQNQKMIVYPKVYSSNQVFPINDYEQLQDLEDSTHELDSDIISLISEELNVEAHDILDIFVLETGKTNRTFKFTAKDKKYIMRIPGEGTSELVDREKEYTVYQLLKGRKISDKLVYLSPKSGYKISEFLEGSQACDPHNKNDVLACMQKLREFHHYRLEVDHTFDLFKEIDHYEELRGDTPSKFTDYAITKAKIKELKPLIADLPKDWVLSHGDSVPGNFLLVEDEVYLIDWEYAGMQDPHIDIAMFALSAMYSRQEVDKLLDYYFVKVMTGLLNLRFIVIWPSEACCGVIGVNTKKFLA